MPSVCDRLVSTFCVCGQLHDGWPGESLDDRLCAACWEKWKLEWLGDETEICAAGLEE